MQECGKNLMQEYNLADNQRKYGTILSYLSLFVGNIIGLLFTPFMLRMLGQRI